MKIGITGGIGSGKSTIAGELARRGFRVYDCDSEAKRMVAEDPTIQQQIIALLGNEAFVHGNYNTRYVSRRVFSEPELLTRLNAIIHPAVMQDILRQSDSTPLFIESAILYESGFDVLCDRVVLVDAPEDIRIARTINRDYQGQATPDNIYKVRARINAQTVHKTNDTIILNNDGIASVASLVDLLLSLLTLSRP